MDVLISIKPEYIDKILKKEKLYELRRSFTKKEIDKLILYCTSPYSIIIGEVGVEEVIYKPIKELREITKEYSCVDKNFFNEYFKGKDYGYAIKLKDPNHYLHPKYLQDYNFKKPPQNFCFIK